jgi:hypothetical protein
MLAISSITIPFKVSLKFNVSTSSRFLSGFKLILDRLVWKIAYSIFKTLTLTSPLSIIKFFDEYVDYF